jgi:hypothetical protein
MINAEGTGLIELKPEICTRAQLTTPASAVPMTPQPVSAKRLPVQRTDSTQRLSDEEYDRLHAKFSFDARIQRRARELRGKTSRHGPRKNWIG